ncbi:NUDIX domain-containing protein [Streptomyces sp. NPDC058398]|uniref:NUDIX domain-containing protein n=1 Tax=Streptomyces sp. NPDC058398 TaxID=3346479 RepID=UPI003668E2B7
MLDADQRVLLVRRGRRLLGNPGSFLEEGETYAKATLRELRENSVSRRRLSNWGRSSPRAARIPRHSGRSFCAPEVHSAAVGFEPSS